MTASVTLPPPDARFVLLHLGLGAFHRAHQAAYLQRLIERGDPHWSIAGGNLRDDAPEVIEALRRQGGAYTLETVSHDGEYRYERITAIREVLPYEPGLAPLIARGADPATRIVSFTVTEAGYYLDDQGRLDWRSPELSADLPRARRGEVGATLYSIRDAQLRRGRCWCRHSRAGRRTRATGSLPEIEVGGAG